MTGAHYDAVKSWIDMGLPQATREPLEQGAPWVADLPDLVTFLQSYTPLAWQAKACNSSTRGLTSRLRGIGVTPIASEDTGRGALVRLTDVFNALSSASVVSSNSELVRTLKNSTAWVDLARRPMLLQR